MRKNNKSSRSIKFIKRNSLNFKDVRDYVSNLCNEVFNIKGFFYKSYINDEMALWIIIGLNKYIVYLDYDYIELKVIENGELKQIFRGDSCWYQSLKWIEQEFTKSLA